MAQSHNEDAVWKALADPTRREIIELLDRAPLTTGELSARFPHLTRYGVMKHLAVLEDADLVKVKREGRMRWNIYNNNPMNEIVKPWVTRHIAEMKGRFEGFRRFVEKGE